MAKKDVKKLEKEIKKGKTKHAALNDSEGAEKCSMGGKQKRKMKGGK